jgi:hypothetical protein
LKYEGVLAIGVCRRLQVKVQMRHQRAAASTDGSDLLTEFHEVTDLYFGTLVLDMP